MHLYEKLDKFAYSEAQSLLRYVKNKPENPFQTMISQINLKSTRVYPSLPESTRV